MVDMAHPLWVISWRSVELQVGWVVHHCHSGGQHTISTLEPLWGSESTAQAVCMAPPSPCTLPHRCAIFYMAMFKIHFSILENSGDGDRFMSSEFQHTLGDWGMADTFMDVTVGSQVTIRHVNTKTLTTTLEASTPLRMGIPILIGRILH